MVVGSRDLGVVEVGTDARRTEDWSSGEARAHCLVAEALRWLQLPRWIGYVAWALSEGASMIDTGLLSFVGTF